MEQHVAPKTAVNVEGTNLKIVAGKEQLKKLASAKEHEKKFHAPQPRKENKRVDQRPGEDEGPFRPGRNYGLRG